MIGTICVNQPVQTTQLLMTANSDLKNRATTNWRFPDSRILLFAKPPVPGKVKTRLIPRLGEAGAAQLYQHMLGHVWQSANADILCPVQLWVTSEPEHWFFAALPGADTPFLQQGADLGARMHHAASTTLQHCEQVLIIGGDCVSLDSDYLAQALNTLRSGKDVVIGPAEDGGYVLLGLRRADVPIFQSMPWGASGVFRQTGERLAAAGVSWRALAERWDVDQASDLHRLPASWLPESSCL